jgi:inner membrane protein
MDPVTHALTGAVLAEAGFAQRLGGRCRPVLVAAAMLPDIDIIYRFSGLPSYIANHRALSHSFVGVLGAGLLLGALFGRIDEERRYLAWTAACWVALISHQLLDMITSYGTVILYPFNNTRYYLDWIFIIDLFLTGALLFTWLMARLRSGNAERIARKGLVFVGLYIVFCAGNHELAQHRLKQSAREYQIPYDSAATIPQPPLPLRWSGILDAGNHYYQIPFFSFEKLQPPFDIFTKTTGSFFEQKARSSEMGVLFYWFARYPVVEETVEGNFHFVEFFDLRFHTRLYKFPVRRPFVLRFKMDGEGNILESKFTRS